MKQFVKKVQFTVLSAMVVLLMMPAMASTSAETLRILEWDAYLPDDHQQKFIKLIKEKYGVDLKLNISYATSTDDIFPVLRDRKADVAVSVHSVPKNERYHLIRQNWFCR